MKGALWLLFVPFLFASGSCASTYPKAPGKSSSTLRVPFVVEVGSNGAKTIYPVAKGAPDRRRPISTVISDWHVENPPATAITCASYHVTQGSSGATKCGMKCSDGTWYGMDCGADIFGSGFDIISVE